jgi:hypothetical protein
MIAVRFAIAPLVNTITKKHESAIIEEGSRGEEGSPCELRVFVVEAIANRCNVSHIFRQTQRPLRLLVNLEQKHRRQWTRSEVFDEADDHSEETRPGRSSLDRSMEHDEEEEEEIDDLWPPDVIDAFAPTLRPDDIFPEMVDLRIARIDNFF